MEINRNNYEEYFLLYADNELSPTEKKVVEIFVQENVDLKEEFLMIRLTVNFPDEEAKLMDKSFLLKKEPSFINENNYEEIFVLYFDNELSAFEKTEVENFVKENSKFKAGFELVEKSKLHPDNLIFYPNKGELYRKEKSGKVIPLILWRTIAAAVFIGFGLWISNSYFNKTEKNIPISSQINDVKRAQPKEKNTITNEPAKEENQIASSTKKIESKDTEKERAKIRKTILKEKNGKDIAIVKPDLKIKKLVVNEKIKEVKPGTTNEVIAATEPVKTTQQISKSPVVEIETARTINKIEPEINHTAAQTVSYVPEASTDNQNYVFYDVSAEEFKKSKVGGFLKKVKRIVERNNPITRVFGGDDGQVAAK